MIEECEVSILVMFLYFGIIRFFLRWGRIARYICLIIQILFLWTIVQTVKFLLDLFLAGRICNNKSKLLIFSL